MTPAAAPPNTPDPTSVPHVLDDPPPFHSKLVDYGERPYWSPDGKRIAFIESNYGDVAEVDVETRQIRNLTRNNGAHHTFLRVLFTRTADYLLIGPREFKDRDLSRYVESELWWMDREAKHPPIPLGQRVFEGIGVSVIADRITYAVSGRHDPSLGPPDVFECRVAEISRRAGRAMLGDTRVVYRTEPESRCAPEPQDFRHADREIIMAEYVQSAGGPGCVVKGVEIVTGRVRTYIDEPGVHNECEGIFPDHEHCCLESSVDSDETHPQSTDLWKLKLDGSARRVRMTRMCDRPPWRATNSNVSPDGRWLAFMVNRHGDEAGFGRGLGLLDLEAWGRSPAGRAWEHPTGRTQRAADTAVLGWKE